MKLRKSRENVLVSGVLGGLGESLGIDPTILRIGFVLLLFTSAIPLIPLYIIGAILMPVSDSKSKKNKQADTIDKQSMKQKNVSEIKEEDWSDF